MICGLIFIRLLLYTVTASEFLHWVERGIQKVCLIRDLWASCFLSLPLSGLCTLTFYRSYCFLAYTIGNI